MPVNNATILSPPFYPEKTKVLVDDIRKVVVIKTAWKEPAYKYISFFDKDVALTITRWLLHYRFLREASLKLEWRPGPCQ